MTKVTFCFEDGGKLAAEAQPGEKLLDTARRAGVSVDTPCNGNGTCGKCRMKLLEGKAEAPASRHVSADEYSEGWRLSCETPVVEDIQVLVPAGASAFRTGIRTADASILKSFEDIYPERALRSLVLQLDEPTLDDTMPDNERVERAASAELGAEAVLSIHALKKLARVLRENAFNVKLILAPEKGVYTIMDILPATDDTPVCGIAIDIGTTTVSAALTDVENGKFLAGASAGNGQIRYGADVINRIIESTRPGGSERLRKAIVDETLVPLIGELSKQSGIPADRIYRVVIAGNTTMEHLLLGLFSDPVRMEPFVPSFFRFPAVRAEDVIPCLNSSCELLLAPNVGSYVGGDITAGVLASRLWQSEETTLFIDLGTNGELVLGNSDYMMCCACSAGPAFEGGDISCGMRATDGAIEEVTIDKETMEPTYKFIGPEGQKIAGLCGSGLIDIVASMFKAGVISAKGKFVREGRRIIHDEHGLGYYIVAFAEETVTGRDITINEVDIDNFIRAKGAIFSAILLLLGQLGLEPDCIDNFVIAGGIGGAIDFPNAITLGMFLDIPLEKFSYIGNSSLSGAYAMLLGDEAVEKTDELSRNMTYVELSNEPGYMDEFVAACFIPHTNASLFPNA